jgi:hypothetical protein
MVLTNKMAQVSPMQVESSEVPDRHTVISESKVADFEFDVMQKILVFNNNVD